jgi:hypothetical protein
MSEHPNEFTVSERELCAATGIDRYKLRRVRRWLFLKFVREFRGRGTGSETYYEPAAVPMIRRFSELQERYPKKIDECVWRLWLEGFPIDMSRWADQRLAALQGELASQSRPDVHKTIGEISSSAEPLKRTDPRRAIRSRLTMRAETSLLLWAIDIALGRVPLKSLHDPASPSFSALKLAAGLSDSWQPPDVEIGVEGLSLGKLRDTLCDATAAEL